MKVEIHTEITLVNLKDAYHHLKKVKLPLTKNPQNDIDNMVAKNTAVSLLFATIKNIEDRVASKLKDMEDDFDMLRDAEDMKDETQTSFIKEAL